MAFGTPERALYEWLPGRAPLDLNATAMYSKDDRADLAETTRVPQLWGTLVDVGLQQLPQGIGSTGSRQWLHIDHTGAPMLVEVDKHRVVADLGVRYRDLLTLDPSVPIPFPAAILIRPKALVVNLETVRMIICSNQCYVLSVPKAADPRIASYPVLDNPFTKQLCKCLRTGKSTATLHDLSRNSSSFDFDAPYELRALEVALATVTNVLDREVFDLEKEAFPTIDSLASNVSKGVLEDVRSVKQVMGRLIGRVQRLKSELEEILEDDADMQDMYLARRAMMLGEDPPPDPLGLAMARSQSAQSIHEGYPNRSPVVPVTKANWSDAELLHISASGIRPASAAGQAGIPHIPSNPSVAGLQSAVVRPGSASPRYAVSESGSEVAALAARQTSPYPGGSPGPFGGGRGGGGGNGGSGGGGRGKPDAPRPAAAEHSGHSPRSQPHSPLPEPGGSRHGGSQYGGSQHGGNGNGGQHGGNGNGGGGSHHGNGGGGGKKHGGGGHGKQPWQRSGTIVRTVRTVKKKKPRASSTTTSPTAAAEAAAAAAAAAAVGVGGGAGGDGSSSGGQGVGASESKPEPALETHMSAPASISVERAPSEAGSDDSEEVIETYIEQQPNMPAVDPHEIEDAEDLLESYFIQIDFILRRLLTLSERIDDTEDLVAIKMDHRRNELVATDLLVTTFTAGFAWVAMIAGIFGMNLWNTVWQENQGFFIAVMLISIIGGTGIIVAIVAWVRHRRLMFIPSV